MDKEQTAIERLKVASVMGLRVYQSRVLPGQVSFEEMEG